MSRLYFEALTETEKKEFPKLAMFKKFGVLVGGTALAFQMGHRRSYDFDIFSTKPLPRDLPRRARNTFRRISVLHHFEEEFSFVTLSGVKITFVYYPFPPIFPLVSVSGVNLSNCRDIALDKAYTIGRRAQYRDYVDLFFLMKEKGITIDWLVKNAGKKFEGLFPAKLFLSQLTYLADLRNFEVEFLRGSFTVQEIKSFFEEAVKQYTQKNIFKKKLKK